MKSRLRGVGRRQKLLFCVFGADRPGESASPFVGFSFALQSFLFRLLACTVHLEALSVHWPRDGKTIDIQREILSRQQRNYKF